MMNKVKTFSFCLALLTFNFLLFTLDCFAQQPVSSSELIRNAAQYDGKSVAFAGEVIGDVMVRGDYAWVNVFDGNNAVGIWVKKELTSEIFFTARYKSKGDVIEVTGIFRRACPQHGGDLDIHADSLRKIVAGRKLTERLNSGKKNQALILGGLLGLVWILSLLRIH